MHPDWENEVRRLEIVKRIIGSELLERTRNSDEYRKQMRLINKEMWEGAGALSGLSTLDETPTFIQDIALLKRNISEQSENSRKVKMLERQINSPYFGRFDFREDNWDTESFYIGIYGLRRADTGEILIYDWRAPVSSMFYDYEPGRALYECPSGYIEGELVLKRQYRIEEGRLILMFDSNVAIEDNILQDILAGSSNNRMKTIVSTIQREQNRAIRYEGKRVIAVQGPAGSGKTSIALHRAAYLLYRYRDNLKAENISLFTPNGAFSKYISTVLPELGEDDLHCITLVELAQDVLGNLFKKYESYAEMMEWQLTRKCSDELSSRWESMHFKTSKQFATVLERFAETFENSIMQFDEIRDGDIVFADKEELEELFHNSYHHMPLTKRLSRMELVVTTRIKEYEKQRRQEIREELANSTEYISNSEIKVLSRRKVTRELEKVKNDVVNMLSINIASLYCMLFEDFAVWNSCGGTLSDETRRNTVNTLKGGILYYEDQAPILYLMVLLGMIDPGKEIKHVIIDEAQDYSEVAFKLFSQLYSHCTVTLLGDLNQNINPVSGIGNLRSAGELTDTKNFEYIELDKSYRSTVEIMEFASRIISSKTIPFGRSGKVPEIVTAETMKAVCNLIIGYVNGIKDKKFRSIAIICRTLSGCHQVYKYLKKELSANLITNGDNEIPSGIIVIPSYLTKGLEFDIVIAVVLSADEYMFNEEQLFYTVCTRALHRLEIFGVEKAGILEKIATLC
ncbi:MAG TPA: AAA family ATPase [Clostridiales bacterium]|nr:AAA family ATPase [Clostridiales bacterium]